MKRTSLFNVDTYKYEDIKFALDMIKQCMGDPSDPNTCKQGWRNKDGTIEVHGTFSKEHLHILSILSTLPEEKDPIDWTPKKQRA